MQTFQVGRAAKAHSQGRIGNRTRDTASIIGIALLGAVTLPAAAQRTATVSVDLNHPLATVSGAAYGVGMSVYDNDFTPADLPEKMKAAGVTALRFPGGSYADIYHWQTHKATANHDIYLNANDTFDNFMTKDVLRGGAQAIITVNYGSNAEGTGGADPAEAAAWVKYANIEKKWEVKYWEIGNEVGGNGYFGVNGWELDLHYPDGDKNKRVGQPALSQDAYGKNALEFIRAMKAVDPTIKIGVGVEFPDKYQPPHNGPLLKRVGSKVDFVIVHWYPQGSTSDLTVTDQILPQTAELRDQLAQYGGPEARNLPIAVTETNGGGPGTARAIFATDTYLTWFEAGAFNVVWQEMHNQGFLSDERQVNEVPLNTPSEPYYGLQLAALAARPGDMLVAAKTSAQMLVAHGVKRRDGGVAVVLINKHPNQPYTVTVIIPGIAPKSSAVRYDFGRANFSFNSPWPSSGIQKSTIEPTSEGFQVTVPAFSETAIVIPAP